MQQETQNISIFFKNTPKNVRMVSAILQYNGYESYLVGGCVRDHIMNNIPEDYDITTNATPEQIISLFPRTFYENVYGTVGVVTISEEEALQQAEQQFQSISQETQISKEEFIKKTIDKITKDSIVEVTPYRLESEYSDGRRPDTVSWSKNIHDDLQRRDFTCNALAYNLTEETLIDDFNGLKDIKDKIIRAVGNPDTRFKEDGLRLLRAIRFAGKLEFEIEEKTQKSIINNHNLLKNISIERIRDEFCKILMSKNPKTTIELANKLKILGYISKEIENGIGVRQNQAHSFDVWEHNLRTLQHAADKNWSLELRLSALFHDVSKPETRRFSKEKGDWTFYGHDVVGGRVSREILTRLKFPKEIISYVSNMVRWHMFFSDTEQISLSAVRRLISNIGKDKIWDLINLRICDRVGTGRPKEEPYRFRKYQSMIEQALTDPISLKQMKIDGQKIMTVTQETPGPKIGMILNALFAEILEDPNKNTEEYLQNRALEIKDLSVQTLQAMADKGKDIMQTANNQQISQIRKQFGVK